MSIIETKKQINSFYFQQFIEHYLQIS